jgi:hypothetical protein
MKSFLLTIVVAASLTAQPTPIPKMEGKVARGADGKPDLSGIWQAIGVTLFGETGELRPGEGTSRTTWGPPVGPAPYKPEFEEKVRQLGSDDRLSPTVQCKMAGVPRITGGVMPTNRTTLSVLSLSINRTPKIYIQPIWEIPLAIGTATRS